MINLIDKVGLLIIYIHRYTAGFTIYIWLYILFIIQLIWYTSELSSAFRS